MHVNMCYITSQQCKVCVTVYIISPYQLCTLLFLFHVKQRMAIH